MSPDEIKALRKRIGLTARELGKALDVDQATVLAWERGEVFPTKRYVDRMRALGEHEPSRPPRHKGDGLARALAEPALWELVRKLAAHAELRAAVATIAAKYSDPAEG